MRTSRRYQLRLGEPLASDLDVFARRAGLAAGAAIRVLLRQALDVHAARGQDSPAALAALLAAEHAVLAVASVLPNGAQRMRDLETPATAAAEARLALFSPGSEQ